MNKHPLSCIIVDDEQDARQLMQHHLERFSHITILAMCDEAESALEAIAQHQPDVVFLDIQMPRKTGFDLLEELKQHIPYYNPTVVFTTAYDQYAIKAIKYAAFDYLLKPISAEELCKTIAKISVAAGPLYDKLEKYLQYMHPANRLRINTRTGYLLINVNEIIYCKADGNYTNIVLGKNKQEVATMNLGHAAKILQNNPQIKRIGRSLLINTNYLYKVDRAKKACVLEKDEATFYIEVPDKYLGQLDA